MQYISLLIVLLTYTSINAGSGVYTLSDSLLSKFIEDNYSTLQKYLRRRFRDLDEYDVEDIIQQTFVKMLTKGRNDINVKSVSSYIYRSVHNSAIDYFKKNSRVQLVDDDFISQSESVEEQILFQELDHAIQDAINSLDEKSKFVFIETELKGRSYENLVEETGEKIGTLLSRKSRTKKKLKSMLEEYMEGE